MFEQHWKKSNGNSGKVLFSKLDSNDEEESLLVESDEENRVSEHKQLDYALFEFTDEGCAILEPREEVADDVVDQDADEVVDEVAEEISDVVTDEEHETSENEDVASQIESVYTIDSEVSRLEKLRSESSYSEPVIVGPGVESFLEASRLLKFFEGKNFKEFTKHLQNIRETHQKIAALGKIYNDDFRFEYVEIGIIDRMITVVAEDVARKAGDEDIIRMKRLFKRLKHIYKRMDTVVELNKKIEDMLNNVLLLKNKLKRQAQTLGLHFLCNFLDTKFDELSLLDEENEYQEDGIREYILHASNKSDNGSDSGGSDASDPFSDPADYVQSNTGIFGPQVNEPENDFDLSELEGENNDWYVQKWTVEQDCSSDAFSLVTTISMKYQLM
ncbi:Protein CBG27767 [Caenorhabditis briggsae]|uniref:Uncharacterized protein n=2 Tax=Caenorhabditis briggsae TaxID=6238 RepID=A0AAE9CWC7_CAEBR|nr:Protein CBG27767 [Caenorhabditis briggsae]ULT82842.1 hypothetical protein L3Y34_012228 [Caenorhabditis briggsae]CAR99534.1 Protein CBG27767 [Caenorhabditis briggsae]